MRSRATSLHLILGGTFDPVHRGHLSLATGLGTELRCAETIFLPSFLPPHRPPPAVSAAHRLQMLRRALAGHGWRIDECELRRGGVSRTVDSLRELRRAAGADRPLCMALGMDAFLALDTWYEWRSLLEYVHLAVCSRSGYHVPASGPVAALLATSRARDAAALSEYPCGFIWLSALVPPECSASDIRRRLAQGDRSVEKDLPAGVWEYIQTRELYEVRQA